ncbi:hypothetical protein Clacol_001525 [Clathrus columnatus]|uniref:Cytochrome c oxidase assembly factor 3 n=1 Tax=Clathrus columnatus TaxID=1419009 RepID=A0AAV5A211_9AGAM|nr:hypothetical protein Clacol_001525 [Clathrus columnatus]
MRPEDYRDFAASKSTYRPKGYGMSPGLLRARRQFFMPNLITGTAIATFVIGVWAYSISAVKQDTFDDVDEQAKAFNSQNSNAPTQTSSSSNPSSSPKS